MLDTLKGLPFCGPFLSRVTRSEAPTYAAIVLRPMDLGTMGKKLRGGEYGDPRAFLQDVHLVASNARLFNGAGSALAAAGAQLAEEAARLVAPLVAVHRAQGAMRGAPPPQPQPQHHAAAQPHHHRAQPHAAPPQPHIAHQYHHTQQAQPAAATAHAHHPPKSQHPPMPHTHGGVIAATYLPPPPPPAPPARPSPPPESVRTGSAVAAPPTASGACDTPDSERSDADDAGAAPARGGGIAAPARVFCRTPSVGSLPRCAAAAHLATGVAHPLPTPLADEAENDADDVSWVEATSRSGDRVVLLPPLPLPRGRLPRRCGGGVVPSPPTHWRAWSAEPSPARSAHLSSPPYPHRPHPMDALVDDAALADALHTAILPLLRSSGVVVASEDALRLLSEAVADRVLLSLGRSLRSHADAGLAGVAGRLHAAPCSGGDDGGDGGDGNDAAARFARAAARRSRLADLLDRAAASRGFGRVACAAEHSEAARAAEAPPPAEACPAEAPRAEAPPPAAVPPPLVAHAPAAGGGAKRPREEEVDTDAFFC